MIIITFVRFANLKLEFQVLKSDDNLQVVSYKSV